MLLRLSIAFPRVIYDNTIGVDRPLHRKLAKLVEENGSPIWLEVLYTVRGHDFECNRNLILFKHTSTPTVGAQADRTT